MNNSEPEYPTIIHFSLFILNFLFPSCFFVSFVVKYGRSNLHDADAFVDLVFERFFDE